MKKARKGNPEKFTGNRELKNGLSVESKGSSVSKVCGQMTSKNQHRQKWSKQEGENWKHERGHSARVAEAVNANHSTTP
tara:strand:+ start:72 stop:308 length:237 start_codon:yes stop_codon:yes gene_type:complete